MCLHWIRQSTLNIENDRKVVTKLIFSIIFKDFSIFVRWLFKFRWTQVELLYPFLHINHEVRSLTFRYKNLTKFIFIFLLIPKYQHLLASKSFNAKICLKNHSPLNFSALDHLANEMFQLIFIAYFSERFRAFQQQMVVTSSFTNWFWMPKWILKIHLSKIKSFSR